MNREIKFRVWDKKDTMEVVGPFSWNKLPGFNNPENFVVLQYTGLNDKNGKEIYEGDKVLGSGGKYCRDLQEIEIPNAEDMIVEAAVCFYKGCFYLNHYPLNNYDELEVIGNIHENPELLNNTPI